MYLPGKTGGVIVGRAATGVGAGSIRDPAFEVKAASVLDLYAGIWDGQPLGPNDFVTCADEQTSVQARCRCDATLPPGQVRTMRVEHEYDRRGGRDLVDGDAPDAAHASHAGVAAPSRRAIERRHAYLNRLLAGAV